MKVNLTEQAIAGAAKRARETGKLVELADTQLPGLRLRASPGGKKAWVLGARDALGAARRFPLGEHPKLGVSAARDAAREMRVKVKAGADPIEQARRTRAIGKGAREGIGTLGALIELYGKKVGIERKSWPESRRRMESVFAKLLKRPVAAMRAADLQFAADSWPSAQSAAAAVRYIRPVLKWASEGGRSYVERDLAMLSPPAKVGRRGRVLSRDELKLILPVLRAAETPYAACMRFLLLTLARREEACAAKWRDIDFAAKIWTISETKNGKSHLVPLSSQAIALLRGLLTTGHNGETVTPKGTALIFATSSGAALANWDRATKAIHQATGTSGWQRHDLRRTGATMLGEMGELPAIIEAALNHVSIHSQLAATYNKARYRPQVAEALQRLGDELSAIEAEAEKDTTKKSNSTAYKSSLHLPR